MTASLEMTRTQDATRAHTAKRITDDVIALLLRDPQLCKQDCLISGGDIGAVHDLGESHLGFLRGLTADEMKATGTKLNLVGHIVARGIQEDLPVAMSDSGNNDATVDLTATFCEWFGDESAEQVAAMQDRQSFGLMLEGLLRLGECRRPYE